MDPLWLIVTLSVLGPIAGSALGVIRRPSYEVICNLLCFAAGVMLAISFLELIPESIRLSGIGTCVFGLVAGSAAMFGVDRLVPHIHPGLCAQEQGKNLQRTSPYLLTGIFMHNLPEGMAISIGGAADASVSVTIAVAIAIHNIPEGVCTAAPYYLATGRRGRAFFLSSLTAAPILAGFLAGRFLLAGAGDNVLGFIVGATAGLMIYITADELIPNARAGESHLTIFSLMAGVIFVLLMGFS
ncbi:MAG: ZIP family metal transporter [Proteobacteria bacterium]|nr:ZIP family metal transporter [Pseudomonadota bacterium]